MTSRDQNTQRTDFLVSRLIDGRLSAEETAELKMLLEADDARLERAVDHLLLDSLLSEQIGRESLTALVDIVMTPEAAGDGASPPDRASGRRLWFMHVQRRFWKPAGWLVAAATVLLAAFLIGRSQSSALASPSALVRAAIETHREPVERVYVVEVEPCEPSVPGATPPRNVRIATQGDRFWLEMMRGDTRWVWGRDPDGAIWLTVGAKWLMHIAPEEVGPSLRSVSEVYSLELETLLHNVLKNCRLKRSAESETTYVITATPGRLWRKRVRVQEMILECDRETRAVRRLVVTREMPQQGTATTTFTLVEARGADASRYRPEGHLIAPYEILSRDSNDARRREILTNWFGSELDRWIKNRQRRDGG